MHDGNASRRFSLSGARHCGDDARLRHRTAGPALLFMAALAAPLCLAGPAASASELPTPTHTVLVVLENHSASQVYGPDLSFPNMPYLKSLAQDGAIMTRATFAQIPYGRTPAGYSSPLPARPSQPNYLYLFAGNDQGVLPEYFARGQAPAWYPYHGTATNDSNGDKLDTARDDVAVGIGNHRVPAAMRPFTTPNLGAAVIAKGGSFASFSESLPYPSYDEETFNGGSGLYKRKHNPVINWIDLGGGGPQAGASGNVLPLGANLGFAPTEEPTTHQHYRGFAQDASGKPLGFEQLPTLSLVVPNQNHDAHDGSLKDADRWLREQIAPYAQWAREHDALLVVLFDEDGSTLPVPGSNLKAGIDTIPVIFYGPMVKPGRYSEPVDHLNMLATMLALHADLDRFRHDFSAAYSGDEPAHELANLRPVLDVFGAGPALAPLGSKAASGEAAEDQAATASRH